MRLARTFGTSRRELKRAANGSYAELRAGRCIRVMDELAELEQAFLSPAKLAAITGCVSEDDLKNVKDLEMKVDSRVTSLSSLGRIMPGLESLKLPHSYIPTIRDLGTGYNVLTHLSLPHCHLRDISGIESLSSLAEVYFPYNNIEELSSLGMLDNLKVLDLEGNAIEDFEEIEQLGLCAALRQLMLRGNPVYEQFVQEEGEDEWRRRIKEVVKPVTVLDGWTVDSGGRLPSGTSRPASASGRPTTAQGRRTSSGSISAMEDTSSELTHGTGQVMAGNPVLFLRTRRGNSRPSTPSSPISHPPTSPSSPTTGVVAALQRSRVVTPTSPRSPVTPSHDIAIPIPPAEPSVDRLVITPRPPATPPRQIVSPRPPSTSRPVTSETGRPGFQRRRVRSISGEAATRSSSTDPGGITPHLSTESV